MSRMKEINKNMERAKANMRMEGIEISPEQEKFIKDAYIKGVSKKEFAKMVVEKGKKEYEAKSKK